PALQFADDGGFRPAAGAEQGSEARICQQPQGLRGDLGPDRRRKLRSPALEEALGSGRALAHGQIRQALQQTVDQLSAAEALVASPPQGWQDRRLLAQPRGTEGPGRRGLRRWWIVDPRWKVPIDDQRAAPALPIASRRSLLGMNM